MRRLLCWLGLHGNGRWVIRETRDCIYYKCDRCKRRWSECQFEGW